MVSQYNTENRLSYTERFFDVLIHWCLIFDKPLSEIEINDKTRCTLRGMLECQNLGAFIEGRGQLQNESESPVACVDKQDCLVDGGIRCTIGELKDGSVLAQMKLEFSPENMKKKVSRNVFWKDIHHVPLIPWLKTIQKQIKVKKITDTQIVSLSGLSKTTGYLGQRNLKYKAALAAGRGVSFGEVPQSHVERHLARDIFNKKEYIQRGSNAKLALYNDTGEVVGRATLKAQ